MAKELKESIEKKRKIAELVYFAAMYVVVIGVCIAFIGLFQADAVGQFMDEEHMLDPTIPYNERDNASFVITPDNLDTLYEKTEGIVIIGAVLLGAGIAVVASVAAVTPSKKERHKLLCGPKPFCVDLEIIYCPSCGLKLSLLEKDKKK